MAAGQRDCDDRYTRESADAPDRHHQVYLSKPQAICGWTAFALAESTGSSSNDRMRTSLVVHVIVLAAVAIAATPREVFACSCMPSGPPCQNYFRVDAVFVGAVQAIDVRKLPLEGLDDRLFDRKLVHLSIERAARGVQGSGVDVWTGMGGGDCGFDFKVGQRYVVYAYRNKDGALGTGICSRTRVLSEAAEDLAYLSAIPAIGKGARVSGTIDHWESDHATGRPVKYGGVPDVQVLVRGSTGVFSAMTDAEGKYAIEGVPPGSYETELLPPPAFSTRSVAWKFEIKDARACQVQDFSLHYAGRVAGTVLDAAGLPVADVRVEIAPSSRPDEPLFIPSSTAKTDGNGHFEIADISPGSYVVGVGITPEWDPKAVYARTMFPAAIEVEKGNRIDIGVLRLPQPSRRYELKGWAVDADGAPIAQASVVLTGARSRQVTNPVRTGPDGSFTLSVFEGQPYTVRAHITVSTSPVRQATATLNIVINGDPLPIRLVLVVR
jgi:hypothetical protein